jgi:hypothetical protein
MVPLIPSPVGRDWGGVRGASGRYKDQQAPIEPALAPSYSPPMQYLKTALVTVLIALCVSGLLIAAGYTFHIPGFCAPDTPCGRGESIWLLGQAPTKGSDEKHPVQPQPNPPSPRTS